MKKPFLFFLTLLLTVNGLTAGDKIKGPYRDSVLLFAYSSEINGGRDGLHFAWSPDGEQWTSIGNAYGFLKCDYGRWGSEKRMLEPFLLRDASGIWHCLWSLNEYDGALAHASSYDLAEWGRQSYPLMGEGVCRMITVLPDASGAYVVVWRSDENGSSRYALTRDFKNYSTVSPFEGTIPSRVYATVDGREQYGTVNKVEWAVINRLTEAFQIAEYKSMKFSETAADIEKRLRTRENITARIDLMPESTKAISELIMGIFFEDINYAADGGIYAELVQNRGFEYSSADNRDWNEMTAWDIRGSGISVEVQTDSPFHINNPHFAVIGTNGTGGKLVNEGFDGIPLKKDAKYDFSMLCRDPEGKAGKIAVRLDGR